MELKFDPGPFQTLNPGAEKTSRLPTAWKDAPAAPNVGLDFQLLRPGAQRIRPKLGQKITPAFPFRSVTGREIGDRLAMGKIQAAPTSN
jgi:hypothetical protein